jgi:UDP-N-acetylmuramate dehydrogenase
VKIRMFEPEIRQNPKHSALPLGQLKQVFGERLQENEILARHTSARIGGPADAFLVVNSAVELSDAAEVIWGMGLSFIVLGSGSNVLVSDAGVRQVVVLNRAREVRFEEQDGQPVVWAESGANLGVLARQAAARGLTGLEWAIGIPGTVGGAVVGNAGAHGSDMAGNLILAEILHRFGVTGPDGLRGGDPSRETWMVEKFAFSYRSSTLKRQPGEAVVLAALLRLGRSTPNNLDEIQARIEAHHEHRRRTQPPGASMGSMFKNPPGDYAGRLIDAAGLKGTRIGEAEISSLHANFFINRGNARAQDVKALLDLARATVAEKFSVDLETEIQLIGEWEPS